MKKEEIITLFLPYYTGREKTVRVFVPDHEENEKMPVVYMTDGQNLFEDNHPHQFGCWYTREAVREEFESSGKKVIIVGIHNDEGPLQRTKELTPKGIGELRFPDEMPEPVRKMMIPEGELFDAFVVGTVIPEIERRFPVETGRNSTAFCGGSSGGLQAFFTVVSHPDKFCITGAFSPAFSIYDYGDVVRWTASKLEENMPYLYFYSGSADKLEKEICDSTEHVYDGLCEFYPPELLSEIILPEQRHHESAWAQIFKDFLHTFLNR